MLYTGALDKTQALFMLEQMQLHILAIGKRNTEFYDDAMAEYAKRIVKPFQFSTEVLAPANSTDKQTSMHTEGKLLLERLLPTDYVIVLDEHGKSMSSTDFAELLQNKLATGTKRIVFVIGGSYGLAQSVKIRCNTMLSLSSMVFPHELARLVLTEQIYRSSNILLGGKYHH